MTRLLYTHTIVVLLCIMCGLPGSVAVSPGRPYDQESKATEEHPNENQTAPSLDDDKCSSGKIKVQ